MPKLRRTVPVLASLDIEKTIDFYVSRLGFEKIYAQAGEYGIAARDDISIHFWACSDPTVPQNTSCRICVEEIEALYAEVKPHGIIHPRAALEQQPWGSLEFGILDGDGNLVTFFEPKET